MVNIVANGRGAGLREQWEGKAQHGQHDVLDRSTAWGRHRFISWASKSLHGFIACNDANALLFRT